MNTNRDEFHKPTRETLAKRVGYHCSNPICDRITIGPNTIADKSTLVGVAAHITAAAPGGPRYDINLSNQQRRSIENGIWLCVNCSTIIDKDPGAYSASLLNQWKQDAESKALIKLTSGNSPQTKTTNRPVVEIDLIYNSASRAPRGYSSEYFEDDTKVYPAGYDFIQFWDLKWNHQLVLMNNSSFPAINIKIEQIAGINQPRIIPLANLNSIQPFQQIMTSSEVYQYFKGTHNDADDQINQTIPPIVQDLQLKITYLNEAREPFETIVLFKNGEIENHIV